MSQIQALSEGYACSPYCLSNEHLCVQSSTSAPLLPPTSRNCSTAQQGGHTEERVSLGLNSSQHHIQGSSTDGKTNIIKNNSAESCYKTGNSGTFIDGTTSASSCSSVYSSSERHSKRPVTVAKSEISGRSSVISQSQESERSTSSSVGVTSISNDSTYSQRHDQQPKKQNSRAGSESKFPNQSTHDSFARKKEKERNPFKWLRRRSEANIRHSNEQQQSHHEANPRKEDRNQQQSIPQETGPDLIDRMEKLEDKLDNLIISHSSESRSTGSTTSSIPCQVLSSPETKTEQREQTQGKGKEDARSQTDPRLQARHIKEKTQEPVQFLNRNQSKEEEQIQVWQALTIEIGRLVKSNNKLSSCVEALGSSGLIELIEILGSSIERLHSELASLRQQQNAISSEKTSLNENSVQQQQQQKQHEAQANIIQRMGVLLGRREEQLKHEKRMNEKYSENIKALEEMVQSLELEWQRVIPFISNSRKASSCLKDHHQNRALGTERGK